MKNLIYKPKKHNWKERQASSNVKVGDKIRFKEDYCFTSSSWKYAKVTEIVLLNGITRYTTDHTKSVFRWISHYHYFIQKDSSNGL